MAKRLVMTNGVSAPGGVAAALLLKRQAAEQPETVCELWAASEGQACAFLRGLLGSGHYSSVQFLDFPRSEELVRELHLAALADGFSFSRPSECAGGDIVREIGLRLQLKAEVFNPIREIYAGEGEHTYPKLFGKAAQLYRETGETVLFYRLVRRLAEGMDAADAALKEAHWLKLVGRPCVFGRTLLDEVKRHCADLKHDLGDDDGLFNAVISDVLGNLWNDSKQCWREEIMARDLSLIPKKLKYTLQICLRDETGKPWSPEVYDICQCRLPGRDFEMERLRHLLMGVGDISPVTIVGEKGTPKETVARLLYYKDAHAFLKCFFTFDCTGVAKDVTRNVFFGHSRGAYPGATGNVDGLLDDADGGGTILLKGVTDMDFELQGQLCHFLETGEFKHTGEGGSTYSTAKFIVAVDKPLEELVAEGCLRPELAMRLSMCRLTLPALRKRKEDIAFIANDFWKSKGLGELTDDQIKVLEDYDYPDNDHELLTFLQRAAITNEPDFAQLMAEHRTLVKKPPVPAPTSTPAATKATTTTSPALPDGRLGDPRTTMADIMRLHACGVYQALGRRKREAARALRISFNTFNKYLDETKTTTALSK